MLRKTLTAITPATADPVTVDELKEWGRIDSDCDDSLLAGLISSATASVELYLKRALVTQTLKMTLDLPCRRDNWTPGYFEMPVSALFEPLPEQIELMRAPIQSITSVTTYDLSNNGSVYSSSNYSLIGDRLVLNSTASWPSSLRLAGAVEIVYAAGYGEANDIPQPIRTAILMTAAAMYDSRGSCDQNGLAPGAARLLTQYRVYG